MLILLPALLTSAPGCAPRSPPADAAANGDAEAIAADLARIRSQFLDRNEVPRFLWSTAIQQQTQGPVELSVAPLRPEEQEIGRAHV